MINSSGASGVINVSGNPSAAANDVRIVSSNLPLLAFGFSIVGRTTSFIANPGGSSGNLCLGGTIGRYVGPGQIMNSGLNGIISLPLDLTMTPQPNGFESIQAGETWSFQTWFRDTDNGMPTSNFTDGTTVTFQ